MLSTMLVPPVNDAGGEEQVKCFMPLTHSLVNYYLYAYISSTLVLVWQYSHG